MQSSEARYEADGDAVMQSVHQPVFEFVQAPRLADWSQDAVVSWKRRWDQYVGIVRQRCMESGERVEVALRPVKNCIEPELLEVLCLYELRKSVDDVTSEELVALIDAKLGSVKNAQVPDLDDFFRQMLKVDLREDDIDARVLKYYRDFATLIKENGLSQILGVGNPADSGYQDRMKLRCTVLIDNLEPKMLRDDVRRHVKYECREAKRNDFTLFGIIKEKARAQHKYYVLAQEQKVSPTSKKEKAVDRSSKPGGKPGNSKPVSSAKSAGGAGSTAKYPSSKNEVSPPKTGCWHCKEPHWLRDCPTASEEDKTGAVEKMKEVRESARGRVKKIGAAPAPGEVLVNNLLTIPYLADTGSEETYLPRQYLTELTALGAVLDVAPLPQVEKKNAAGGNVVECRDAVTLDLLLQTAARPVHLSEVTCKVMEGCEEDFILGNDTLVTLGIDVNEQLSQLAAGPPAGDEDPFDLGLPAVVPPSEIRTKLQEMVTTAGDNGFDKGYLRFLREAVLEFEDVFRIDLLADPPADVEPLRITLQPDAQPFRARTQRYGPAQSAFLREHVRTLEKMGFVRRNNMSRWACAAVPVPKAGRPNEFRLTIDYRPVNVLTIPIAGTGADLTSSSENVDGAYGFAGFDMPSGFSQLPLDDESQEIMSFITDDGVWTPCRVQQGAADSPLHFQNQMNVAFADMLYVELLIWIDDILLYARTPRDFVAALRRFLTRVRERRLKLSVVKSFLFRKEAKWCGRIFCGAGIRHDPERLSGLREMPLPSTAADLQQFLCATGWMRDSLMDYSRVMQPLHDKLEEVLKVVGRTKRLAAGATITWSDDDVAAFADARQLLTTAQTLHFPSSDASICVMPNASDRGWGLVVSQVRDWIDGVPVTEQRHELLVCKSGKFDATAKRWSIIEKEAFPIIWAARNLTYLLVRANGFRLYCDHKNLIYVFAPDQEVKSHVRGKLQRWAMSLTGLPYQIEHIDGQANLWADLLSRWGLPGEEGGVTKCKAITRSRTRETSAVDKQMQQLHLRAGDFVFPTLIELQDAQRKHAGLAPPTAQLDRDGTLMVVGCVWVPEVEVALLQRILIVAHCGSQGHRGIEPMMTTVTELFEVVNLAQVCRRFLSRCLLCKHVKGGNIIPRPWGPMYDAKERNELLHVDYLYMGDSVGACKYVLYMGDSVGACKYVLVLKDGLTHFCELVACDSPTSAVAASGMLDWWKRFGAPSVLVSDQGSHFKSEMIRQVCKTLDIEQSLVVVYAPWINGTIERLNRDVLQVVRVLLMEYKLDTREWVYLLPLVQGNLNHTPV